MNALKHMDRDINGTCDTENSDRSKKMWDFLSKELFSKSVYLNEFTNVWQIALFEELFDEIKKEHKIVLGGDIITEELKYTHDSWYFEPQEAKSREENCIMSLKTAETYLTNYMKRNGDKYYIDIVLR